MSCDLANIGELINSSYADLQTMNPKTINFNLTIGLKLVGVIGLKINFSENKLVLVSPVKTGSVNYTT